VLLISEVQSGLHAGQTGADYQDPAVQKDSLGGDALGKVKALNGRSNQARGLLSGGGFIGMNPGTVLADIDPADQVRVYVVRREGLVESCPVVGGCTGGNEGSADSLVLEGGEELVGAAGLAEGVATDDPGDAGQSADRGGDSEKVELVGQGSGTFTEAYGQARSAVRGFGFLLLVDSHVETRTINPQHKAGG
jgi:hypothetical protein